MSNPADAVTLSSTKWQRVVTPVVTSTEGKHLTSVELWVRRKDAVAQTFYTDNARIIRIA